METAYNTGRLPTLNHHRLSCPAHFQFSLDTWRHLTLAMSVVTIQLGQCGNQIGSQLFSTLLDDARSTLSPASLSPPSPPAYYETSMERFFVAREEKPLQVSAVGVRLHTRLITLPLIY